MTMSALPSVKSSRRLSAPFVCEETVFSGKEAESAGRISQSGAGAQAPTEIVLRLRSKARMRSTHPSESSKSFSARDRKNFPFSLREILLFRRSNSITPRSCSSRCMERVSAGWEMNSSSAAPERVPHFATVTYFYGQFFYFIFIKESDKLSIAPKNTLSKSTGNCLISSLYKKYVSNPNIYALKSQIVSLAKKYIDTFLL